MGKTTEPAMKTQLTKLLNWFDDKNSVLVALSGGVDSALVAYAAYTRLGKSAMEIGRAHV